MEPSSLNGISVVLDLRYRFVKYLHDLIYDDTGVYNGVGSLNEENESEARVHVTNYSGTDTGIILKFFNYE